MGVGPESPHYENLRVGEMIGGPFEDTTGPALNNFIKSVAVFAFITESLYNTTPENTWPLGFAIIASSLLAVGFSKFGLTLVLNCVNNFLKQRQLQAARDAAEEEEEEDEEDDEDFDDEDAVVMA